MTTFAEQHLEQWASFAELSTKHGKIVPQRTTTKVKLLLWTCFSFFGTEMVWWGGPTVKLYTVADSDI